MANLFQHLIPHKKKTNRFKRLSYQVYRQAIRDLRAFFACFVVKRYDTSINPKNRDVAPTALGFLTLKFTIEMSARWALNLSNLLQNAYKKKKTQASFQCPFWPKRAG